MKYSESQLKAIYHNTGPGLVLAVPGSGKTTVLLARIQNLINQGVNPENILAMTFSKSQALDMEKRYFEKYGDSRIKFSTIHSFAYGIIRSFSNGKSYELIESSKNYNKYKLVQEFYFRIKHKPMTDEQLENFFRVSSYMKNSLMDYEEYKKHYSPIFRDFEKVYDQYENFKRQRNLIDFDDMLIEALSIVQKNKSSREFLQSKFKYIQIDEGQDTSFVQLMLISLIALPENNLFIVADDDQSIYGFRGASSQQLLDFPKNYPDAKIYYMEDNFRSTKNITKISNRLIKNNKNRYHKIIKSSKDDGPIISFTAAKTSRKQAEYVIEEAINNASKGETTAILYRNNISAISLVNSFPDDSDFYIKDGKLAFYSHQIITDIKNITNFSKDNYDIETFEKIYYKFNLFIKKDFVEQVKFMDPSRDVIERLKMCEGLNNFFLEKIYLLSYLIDKLSDMDFYDGLLYIIYDMDYYEYLKEFSRRTSTTMLAIDRVIDTLINISKGVKTLAEFDQKCKYLIEKQKEHSQSISPITLSTIHGSKGLEFDNVYVIDLIEKEFPSSYSEAMDEKTGVLEEERRLFYVSMTRAKKKLNLLYPKKLYINPVDHSSFLDEIADNN